WAKAFRGETKTELEETAHVPIRVDSVTHVGPKRNHPADEVRPLGVLDHSANGNTVRGSKGKAVADSHAQLDATELGLLTARGTGGRHVRLLCESSRSDQHKRNEKGRLELPLHRHSHSSRRLMPPKSSAPIADG